MLTALRLFIVAAAKNLHETKVNIFDIFPPRCRKVRGSGSDYYRQGKLKKDAILFAALREALLGTW